MHDALFADQGRLEDPHLWARAERLGLDVARFDADRRSDAVAARVARATSAAACAPAWRPRRRCSSTASATPGGPTPALLGAAREPRAPNAAYTRAYAARPRRPTPSSSSACAPTRPARRCARSTAPTRGELFGFALNALGERGAAEEIVQEVFTRAWRHAERYDPARGSVRTWLYQIARHAIIDARRRAAVRPALAAARAGGRRGAGGARSIEQAMLGWQVAAALERLTPEHRQMIRLAHFQGLTHARDRRAHATCRSGTVKSRTWYALRSLRLVLEEMGVR